MWQYLAGVNRDQLIDLVKGRQWAAYDRGVDTRVMRLRKKTEPDPSNSIFTAAAVGITLPVNKRSISGIV